MNTNSLINEDNLKKSKIDLAIEAISSIKTINDTNIITLVNNIEIIISSFNFRQPSLYVLKKSSNNIDDDYILLKDGDELDLEVKFCQEIFNNLREMLISYYIEHQSMSKFNEKFTALREVINEHYKSYLLIDLMYKKLPILDISDSILTLCHLSNHMLYISNIHSDAMVKKINEDLITSNNRNDIQFKEYDEYFTKSKNSLEQLKLEINNLLAEAGEKTLIKNHLDQANKERLSANILRIISIIFLMLSSCITIYSLFLLHKGDMQLTNHIVRLVSALIISLPAIYLIKESNSHKKDERHYRDLGLDLAAIPSYLRGFDDETAKDLKKNLSNKLFAKQRDISSNTVPIDYQDLIKTVLQQAVNSSKDNKKE